MGLISNWVVVVVVVSVELIVSLAEFLMGKWRLCRSRGRD